MLSPATAHHSCQVTPRTRPPGPGGMKQQPDISPSTKLLPKLIHHGAHTACNRSHPAGILLPSAPSLSFFSPFFLSLTESNKQLYEDHRKWVGERERQKQRDEDIKPQLKSSSSLMRALGIKAQFSTPQESCEACSAVVFTGDR